MLKTLNSTQTQKQTGFGSDFRTAGHIYKIREVITLFKVYQLPLALIIKDFKKAFDLIYIPSTIIETHNKV